MPVSFHIMPDRGLVLVTFQGYATIKELDAASVGYRTHPDYSAGQKQLVDLTHVKDFERDYVGFMAMQAAKAERLEGKGVQSLAVYVAPNPASKEISTLFIRTWGHAANVVALAHESEAEALSILGQRETSIQELLAATGTKA